MTGSILVFAAFGFLRDLAKPIRDRISDTKSQKMLILTIVCIALLLDNMLYMVIVPIINEFLDEEKHLSDLPTTTVTDTDNHTASYDQPTSESIKTATTSSDDGLTGVLFASKAIVQLMANPFTGTFIDRIGYVIPLTLGLMVMFTSTMLFAFARTFGILFLARSMQGLGSALADTAALGLIADRFHNEKERSKALGIALAFISFGSLVAPPFGGILFEYVGIEWPFLILALICLIDAALLLLVQIPASDEIKAKEGNIPVGTPIYKLFMDPYIAVIALSLMLANFPLAFLEPTIAKWMKTTMDVNDVEIGIVWLPAFIPHIVGVYITVWLAAKYFRYQWLCGALGLILIGVSTAAVPTCKSYVMLMLPLAFLCFGIALIDTALLPTLAFLVDVRHTSVYGSVYAIADISYSIAYALGPILAGQTVQSLGYLKMNLGIGILNMMFAPLLLFLRDVYDWKPDKTERITLLETNAGVEAPKPLSCNSGETNFEYGFQNPKTIHVLSNEDDDERSNLGNETFSKNKMNFRISNDYLDQNQEETFASKDSGTSIAPRPRPKARARSVKPGLDSENPEKEQISNGNISVNNSIAKGSGDMFQIKGSMSRQELKTLAESETEVCNPLFQL